ncbi:MAG: DNA methyltransferase [Candidatus Poribacteria bacterium]|nr:DNA methyltransferase [Candidatus Poribacteria bacterium]
MRALSLHDGHNAPWLTLIRDGIGGRKKTLETRNRPTRVRGDVLLCGAKKPKGRYSGLAACVVTIVDCRPMTKADEQAACCELYPGAYVWQLDNIRPIDPFPVSGRQGFFNVDYTPPGHDLSRWLNQVHVGDAFDLTEELPAESVDLICTSPPYLWKVHYDTDHPALMGMEADIDTYLRRLIGLVIRYERVLKPTGVIAINLGDTTRNGSPLLIPERFLIAGADEPRLSLQLRDKIAWTKENPPPRSRTGIAKKTLLDAWEHWYILSKSRDWRADLQEWNPDLDASPQEIGDRKGLSYRRLVAMSDHLTPAQKQRANDAIDRTLEKMRSGDLADFRVRINGEHKDKFGNLPGGRKSQMERDGFYVIEIGWETMKRNWISTAVENIEKCGHPAVFPLYIADRVVRTWCPPDGVVLDTFLGSGQTAIAADQNDRDWVGFELSPQYATEAEQRIVAAQVERERNRTLFEFEPESTAETADPEPHPELF